MQGTNVRGPSGECAVASVEARVRSRINIWNCKRKSNKQLGPLKELLGTLQVFTTITVKLQAIERSTIQFWNFLAKGHTT